MSRARGPGGRFLARTERIAEALETARDNAARKRREGAGRLPTLDELAAREERAGTYPGKVPGTETVFHRVGLELRIVGTFGAPEARALALELAATVDDG